MDDDDIYNKEYIEYSVNYLRDGKLDIVGCRDMIITWPDLDFETRFVRGITIHEGTMVFRKSHWRKQKFKETTTGEGTQMVSGSFNNNLDIRNVMICLAHDNNTFDKTSLLENSTKVEIGSKKKEYLKEIINY